MTIDDTECFILAETRERAIAYKAENKTWLDGIDCHYVTAVRQLIGRTSITILVLPNWHYSMVDPKDVSAMRETLGYGKATRNWKVLYIR